MNIPDPPLPVELELPVDHGGDDAPLAEAMLCGGWDTERDLVVLVGPAPGPAVTALRRLGQQRIIWFRTGDVLESEPAGVLCVDHVDEVAAAVRALGAVSPDRVTGRALDPALAPLYQQVLARIERARGERELCGGGTAAARDRIVQGRARLRALCRWPNAAALRPAMVGMPLVIVAPGPSLARNINLLATLHGRAFLLALTHSLAPLRRAGITPDFVLAADSHDVGYQLAGEDLSGIAALVATATAHPQLFHSEAPRHLTLSEPGPIDSWLGELAAGPSGSAEGATPRAMIGSGGSVAHTALSLGLVWGCDPIGFVGLDLSFPGGRCYVDTSRDREVRAVASSDRRTLSLEGWSEPERRGRAQATERLVELPSWDGRSLTSSFHFSMCKRWFEETARQVAGARLYNCSEGGAYIGGMRHIRLSGLASRLPPSTSSNPASAALRAVAEMDPRSRRRAARERLIALALELRRCALAGSDRGAQLAMLPILSALVEAELSGESAAQGGTDRRRAAMIRWATWLEPRVVEAERALAREDRASETIRLRPISAAAALGRKPG